MHNCSNRAVPLDEMLFEVLIFLLFIFHGSSSFKLHLTQTYGEKRVILSEIQLYNQGILLPESRLIFRYSGAGNDSDVATCMDGDLKTTCHVRTNMSGVAPSLTVDSSGLFFDLVVLHSVDYTVFGLTASLTDERGIIFWESTVSDQMNFHAFDFQEEAMAAFPIKIVSTFSYNGEPAALFHVQYLFPVVNEFIIVESRYTLSGHRKNELYFENRENRAAFAPYISKIRFLVVEEFPPRPSEFIRPQSHDWIASESMDSFWREHYQRAYVKGFVDHAGSALYMCLDADEIPSREVVAQFRDEQLYSSLFAKKIRLEMLMFYYNFKWSDTSMWTPPYVVNTAGYLAEEDMVLARDVNSDRSVYVPRAGWHLSFFLSKADVVRKIESFAHREFDHDVFKADDHVTACLREGRDLFNRENFRLSLVDLEASELVLPKGWREFQLSILQLQE